MQSMDQSLAELYFNRAISRETAEAHIQDTSLLQGA